MAKTCSRCGKKLSFRESFVWEGNPICGACFKLAKGGVPSAVTPAEEFHGVRGWLLLFVIGCFITAIWNLVLGLATIPETVTNKPYNLFIAVLSIITGAALITSRNNSAVYVARFYLAAALIGNLIIAIVGVEPPPGYYLRGGDTFLWRSVIQAILFNVIWQTYFVRSRRVRATYSFAAPDFSEFLAIRRYPSLFDRQRDGINYYAGAGLLLASLLTSLIASAAARGVTPMPLMEVVFALLEAAAFLILSYLIRNQWLLPMLFGLIETLFGIGRRAMFNAMQLENMDLEPAFSPSPMVFGFFWGFFFMLGLIAAVRLWGPKWWSLMLGITLMMFINLVGRQMFSMLTTEGASFDPVLMIVIGLASIPHGILFGALIYAGLVLHLKQKGLEVHGSTIPKMA